MADLTVQITKLPVFARVGLVAVAAIDELAKYDGYTAARLTDQLETEVDNLGVILANRNGISPTP